MFGFVSGKVILSHNSAWQAGDLFGANLPFTTYYIVTPDLLTKTVMWKLTGLINES